MVQRTFLAALSSYQKSFLVLTTFELVARILNLQSPIECKSVLLIHQTDYNHFLVCM